MISNNQIVIVISSEHGAETIFLNACGRQNKETWNFASTNGSDYKRNKLVEDFNFVLINPKPPEGSWQDIFGLVGKYRGSNVQYIVWHHNGDDLSKMEIQKTMEGAEVLPGFSHQGTPIEDFMTTISQKRCDFQKEFEKIIKVSLVILGNDYLSALFILCQGFLAAYPEALSDQDQGDFIRDLRAVSSFAKKDRIGKDWWNAVFVEEGMNPENFENTQVFRQLVKLGEQGNPDILKFFQQAHEGNVEPKIVFRAYRFLKEDIFSRI